MFRFGRYGLLASTALALTSTVALAQEITTEIRGSVVDTNGNPVVGASVTVVDTRTGQTRTTTTNAAGGFSARSLAVGGPFTVTVTADGFQGEALEGVFTELSSGATVVAFDLEEAGADADDVIVVTATVEDAVQVAMGPAATFGLDQLENRPAINRSIKDIIGADPRIVIDESFVDSVNCAGANSRFNSLTIDGVRSNDNFGLNSNGFPTQNQPFPYDSVQGIAVELAPVDVQYGGFSACNINIVTKSGTNDFHGSVWFDYASDGLQGDSLEGESLDIPEFNEYRYGATLGGPIIRDKLFFFASYERVEGADTFTRGFVGSGAINEVAGFSEDDYNEILRIARDVYDYEPGGTPSSFDFIDEKLLVKLDWLITDDHRATFTYNYNDGFNTTQSDGDNNEFEYSNHLYERGAVQHTYIGSLFSDWSDNFSTEIRVGYLDNDNSQESIGGTDFGEFQIGVGDDQGNNATVYLGGDDSRQSNDLDYTTLTTVFKGFYSHENHLFTFGFEREATDIFNLFVQHTEGEYRFGSIADFEAGEPWRIEYANAPSRNPDDAAADWGYAVNSVYFQDEWELPQYGLTLTGGLRYDWYTSDDVPAANADFEAQYGYTNAQNLDGKSILQPRFGFNWEATDYLSVRGGIGRYAGGNPNVWISNNYSGNNTTQFTVRDSDVGIAGVNLFDLTYVDCEDGVPVGPGYCIPAEMAAAVSNGGRNFEINVLDPDFEIPAEWKYSLGATYLADVPYDWPVVGGEFVVNADLLFSRSKNAAVISRIDLEQVGTLVAGIPDFSSPNIDAFQLTNGEDGNRIFNASFSVQKSYDFGLDVTLGYAYTDAEDENPMTSSVAFSNYNNRSFVNPEAPGRGVSNYARKHRITMAFDYAQAFWQDYETKFSLFGSISSGEAFSYTFQNANNFFGFTPFLSNNTMLLYVPTGPNDPNVVFADGFDTDAFFRYINAAGLDEEAGGFSTRNGYSDDWFAKFDLRIAQEFPGLFDGHKSQAFFVLENVGNFLNDDWGILRAPNFPDNVAVVDGGLTNGGQQFIFNGFSPAAFENPTSRVGAVSLWAMRVGVKYEF